MKKFILLAVILVTAVFVFTACGRAEYNGCTEELEIIEILPDAVPLTALPENSPFRIPVPVASGVNVRRAARAEIDYSNTADGYVMVRFLVELAGDDVRVLVDCPQGIRYQYHLRTDGRWDVFPLSGGNGEYIIRVMERVDGRSFATVVSVRVNVTLTNEFAPFLRPNQFVNFHRRSDAVLKAAYLVRDAENVIESVAAIYSFVIENIEYDFELAATVRQPFIPDIDLVLKRGKGICFDYASLMTAMLRSQGIPTKLVIGYVGDLRHAWISVHTEEYGWINNIIWFDGEEWHIMDPTFAAGGAHEFIGDGENHNPTHFH